MSLCDILACEINQLEEIIIQEDPYSKGSWFKAKNIGMIELSKLGEMLEVGSYDSLSDGFKLVGEPLDQGPWPQTIPVELTDRLSVLSEDEIIEVCDHWSKIEEFRGHAAPDALKDYLLGLREFLVSTKSSNNHMFLVNAL